MRWLRVSIAWLMAVVLLGAVAIASLRYTSEQWAGVVVLLTLGVLAASLLGVLYRREGGRAWWAGFALFGWLYMGLTASWWLDPTGTRPALLTTAILDRLEPSIGPLSGAGSALDYFGQPSGGPNGRIYKELEKPASLQIMPEMSLSDVIKYVKGITSGPGLVMGLPIHVDPRALERAGASPNTMVSIDLDGIPLGKGLSLLLAQAGLRYVVNEGVIEITDGPPGNRPEIFQRIGHCWWAILFGCLGGMIGKSFHATRDRGGASS